MNGRDKSLDYAKGFAIILMIFSHCLPGDGLIKTWIFSFHMPIFFLICGIISEKKKSQRNIISYLKTRFFQLFVPYFFWGFILIVFYHLLSIIGNNPTELLFQLKNLLLMNGIDSLWFIPCYFFSEFIYIYIVRKMSEKNKQLIFISLIVYIFFFSKNTLIRGIPFFLFLTKVCIGLTFVIIGALFEKSRYQNKKLWFSLALLIFGSIGSFLNGFSAIGSLEINNIILFYFDAVAISISIIMLIRKFGVQGERYLRIVEKMGKESIVVLCTNNLLIEAIRLIDYKLFKNIMPKIGSLSNSIILFLIVSVLEYLIIVAEERTGLKLVFGKKVQI